MKYMKVFCIATSQLQAQKNTSLSGNPIIKGWYAHPETAILKNSIGFIQPILINTTNRFFLCLLFARFGKLDKARTYIGYSRR